MTDSVIQKLEDAFTIGATVNQACDYANIAPSTFYKYCDETEGFMEKVEIWRSRLGLRAKMVVNNALQEGDVRVAMDVLKSTDPDYKEKKQVELTGKDGGALVFTWDVD